MTEGARVVLLRPRHLISTYLCHHAQSCHVHPTCLTTNCQLGCIVPLGDSFRDIAKSMLGFADAVVSISDQAMVLIANTAVDRYIIPNWPVDTGWSASQWDAAAISDGARIYCRADYSSYVFKSGDTLRVPIYLELVPWAVERAVEDVGFMASLVDVTDAYFGQGRTTTNITGPSQKMIRHTPKNEAEAWRKYHPEMIERVEVFYQGQMQVVELVPSDTIATGGGGSFRFG